MSFFDFSDVKEFEAIPAGSYNAKLTGFKFVTSKNGKRMLNLEFTLMGELQGRKMWRNFMLDRNEEDPTKDPRRYLKAALVVLGANPDSFTGSFDLQAMLGGLMSAQCTLDISEGMYQGKKTNSVDNVRQYQPVGW